MLLTAAALVVLALVLGAVELDRRHMRRLIFRALMTPQAIEQAWVSPPDEDGLRRLLVRTVDDATPRTVAMDFDVDDVVRRFTLAGIRVGYEHEGR